LSVFSANFSASTLAINLSTKDDTLLVADLEVYLLILSELKVIHFQRTWLVPMLHLPCYNASSDSVRCIYTFENNSILSSVLLSAITLILGLIVFLICVPSGTISYMEGIEPPQSDSRPSALPKPCGFFSAIESLNTSSWFLGRSYGRSRITPQLLILYT
jgi:hypothetical protein